MVSGRSHLQATPARTGASAPAGRRPAASPPPRAPERRQRVHGGRPRQRLLGPPLLVSSETAGDTMPEPLQPEILATLVCEPARRPNGAPTLGEIVPAVRSARRDERQLTVTFD